MRGIGISFVVAALGFIVVTAPAAPVLVIFVGTLAVGVVYLLTVFTLGPRIAAFVIGRFLLVASTICVVVRGLVSG